MLVLHHLIKVQWGDRPVLYLFILSFALNSWFSEATVDWFAGDTFEILSSVTFGTVALFAALLILKWRHIKKQRHSTAECF